DTAIGPAQSVFLTCGIDPEGDCDAVLADLRASTMSATRWCASSDIQQGSTARCPGDKATATKPRDPWLEARPPNRDLPAPKHRRRQGRSQSDFRGERGGHSPHLESHRFAAAVHNRN
ncbi:MAG: hypothetical protein DMF90_19050, partial [Acidobacteria bacterium]